MSTDAVKRIDEAREALRETVQRLAEIADGLRGEPELPPEPPVGSVVVVGPESLELLSGAVYRRYHDGWAVPGEEEFATWAELCSFDPPPVLLVRADQTVLLPSEFPDRPTVEWAPSGTSLIAHALADFRRLKFVVRQLDSGEFSSALVPFADAERWLLETLALVRSKGGAS